MTTHEDVARQLAAALAENSRLREEISAMRSATNDLVQELASSRVGQRSDRETRHAALNRMEDAVVARHTAETAIRAKDDFLAVLGHELRTPITAIVLWARTLRNADPEMISRAIDAIEHSAEHQVRLIEDLLDMSRLSTGILPLSRTTVNITSLVGGALEAVGPLAASKRIALTSQVTLENARVMVDATRLKQILWNLLMNAIKFTHEGGNVRLCVRKTDVLELEVIDTGCGIIAPLLPHMFDKSWQVDMLATRTQPGLGIGLKLAKQLAELHGGTIEARSDGEGRGASFLVTLPWVEPPSDAVVDVSTIASPLADVRVLLVDDHQLTRDALRWTLEHAGAHVVAVETAPEALAAFDRSEADVLVSDLALPGMSGFELVERIVERCHLRGERPFPACAVSAHTGARERRLAIDVGFDIYLTKPVTPEGLVEAVVELKELASADR